MTGTLQVLGFGAIAVDDIIYVDRSLGAGKGRVTARITDHGGNVATALVAVARLGGRAGFIGWLNSDPGGDISAHDLARHHVDISHAPRRPDATAIRSVITVGSDGERFIAFDDAVPLGTSAALADDILAQAQVLLVDGYATVSHAVVARARDLGLAVVGDIEWSVGPATDALMTLCDHLVLPCRFAMSCTGTTDPAAALAHLWSADRAAVILTDGDHGAFVRQRGDTTLWHLPAHQVVALDTTGAGDCFHGAYAFALTMGKPLLDCARFAGAAAAVSVMGRGGRLALPDHEACLAMLARSNAPVPVAIGQVG